MFMCSAGLVELSPVKAAMTARIYLMLSQKMFVAPKSGCRDRDRFVTVSEKPQRPKTE